jgi:ribosome-binding factor A
MTMSIDRLTRVNELMRREIGESLLRLIPDAGGDASTVTVTHVITSKDLRVARVLVSVRGTPAEQEKTLGQLRRWRTEIQRRVNKDLTLKYTPRLQFQLDSSVADGDRVLQLLARMEEEDVAPDPGMP